MTTHDPVNSPAHYTHPTGVECKHITYDLPTWLGSAIKYIWRRDRKGAPIQDRQKAIECLRASTKERMDSIKSADTPLTWARDIVLVSDASQDNGDLALAAVLDCALFCAAHGFTGTAYGALHATIERLEEELEILAQKEAH